VNKLKSLNHTLLFKVGQWPLLRQFYSERELVKGLCEIVKALLLANIFGHDFQGL
jgi:hypothetical protein